ncbi:hypothetical protein EJ02DRAFT_184575 [Clathrospora elynae]|uniref:Uncharacterized protein n=1 Tax=Clathrospora elynae TaxID=706981 RepID=A0A6A5SQX0_9PLEO|nr:hypothetical protein EJ02DRAFT_184575 [Clathrospora elynae]
MCARTMLLRAYVDDHGLCMLEYMQYCDEGISTLERGDAYSRVASVRSIRELLTIGRHTSRYRCTASMIERPRLCLSQVFRLLTIFEVQQKRCKCLSGRTESCKQANTDLYFPHLLVSRKRSWQSSCIANEHTSVIIVIRNVPNAQHSSTPCSVLMFGYLVKRSWVYCFDRECSMHDPIASVRGS